MRPSQNYVSEIRMWLLANRLPPGCGPNLPDVIDWLDHTPPPPRRPELGVYRNERTVGRDKFMTQKSRGLRVEVVLKNVDWNSNIFRVPTVPAQGASSEWTAFGSWDCVSRSSLFLPFLISCLNCSTLWNQMGRGTSGQPDSQRPGRYVKLGLKLSKYLHILILEKLCYELTSEKIYFGIKDPNCYVIPWVM